MTDAPSEGSDRTLRRFVEQFKSAMGYLWTIKFMMASICWGIRAFIAISMAITLNALRAGWRSTRS